MKESNNFQEMSKVCIECITPVNIADGTKLTAKDYLYDAKQGKAYFLNQLAWHKFIYAKKLLPAYEKYLTDFREKRSLYEWLQSCGYGIENVVAAIKSSTSAEVNVVCAEEKKTLNEIICHSKLSDGTVYIPGSSIKGVIRTAILFDLLQKNPDVKSKYWKNIEYAINGLRVNKRDLNNVATALEGELLHKLVLVDKGGKSVNSRNAVCSVMRGISCSDAYAETKVATAILQKIDETFDRHAQPKENKISVFRESILPHSKFYFELKIEKSITKQIGIESVDDVLEKLDSFFNFVRNLLENTFEEKYSTLFGDMDLANAYLGGNTGFLTKTLFAVLAPDRKQATDLIRVLMNDSFKKHKHMDLDKHISPRTLKTTYYSGKHYLTGLVKVYKDE